MARALRPKECNNFARRSIVRLYIVFRQQLLIAEETLLVLRSTSVVGRLGTSPVGCGRI
jgi:hypothetical protein